MKAQIFLIVGLVSALFVVTGCSNKAQASGDVEKQMQDNFNKMGDLDIELVDTLWADMSSTTVEQGDQAGFLCNNAKVLGHMFKIAYDNATMARWSYGYARASKDTVGDVIVAEKRNEFYRLQDVAKEARERWMSAREAIGLITWSDPGFWDSVNPF